jgi:4-hydroxy-3-polyprenylbenzoate decarboxylase
MIIVCDDADFVGDKFHNYLWVTYTRCNPSHDIYGIDDLLKTNTGVAVVRLVIDARIKPHHAPPVEKDPAVEKNIERFFNKGGSLYNCKII